MKLTFNKSVVIRPMEILGCIGAILLVYNGKTEGAVVVVLFLILGALSEIRDALNKAKESELDHTP